MAAIIELGGVGATRWEVTSGHAADHPDARSAAIHARVTGSVGCTYNGASVRRAVQIAPGVSLADFADAADPRRDREAARAMEAEAYAGDRRPFDSDEDYLGDWEGGN